MPDIVGSGLLPSPADEHLRREHALAGELAATLEQLSGVAQARVHLRLPAPSQLSGQTNFEPRAAVLLRCDSPTAQPDIEATKRLLVAAVPGLLPERIAVEITRSTSPPERLVRVGPLRVAQASAAATRALLAGLLGLVLLMGAALCVLGWRQRRRHWPK